MSGTEDIVPPTTAGSGDEIDEGEYTEEEVEVEVSDADDSAEEETAKIPEESPSVGIKKTKKPTTPAKGKGKVQPSNDVKNAPMESPESLKKKGTLKFNPDKNPFPTNGVWNSETLKQIDIVFPVLTGKNETTNELTRSSKPDMRYWKAPIPFKFGNFTSDTLRFDNVHIPFSTSRGYGETFVYMSLPSEAGEAFGEAGRERAPTKITEASLMPDSARWWKVANKIEGLFGVINNSTKKFQPKSLATIFDSTQSGISASVVCKFYCKAATDDKSALRATTARTISAEIIRGYITEVDVNVQLPRKVDRQKNRAEPTAVSRDVATDALMQRLGDLGL